MVYTSTENKLIKDLKKLNTKKYRDESKMFLVEGEHLVLEAYKKGALKKLIALEDVDFDIDIDIETIYVSDNVMKYLSELDNPCNMIGVCEKLSEKNLGRKILILDDIQDPGNLGTIIRSAVAFNVDTIVLSDNTVDLYNSKVIRASQGMLFNINIIKRNLLEFIPALKTQEYKIYATRVNGGKSLKNIEIGEKFAIIMGNEGNGVSEEILKYADQYLYIEMNNNCESLNVAIATSIILYELNK